MPLSFRDVARAAENFRASSPGRTLEVFLHPADFQNLQLEYQRTPGAIPGQLINIGGFTLRCNNEVTPGTVYIVMPPEFVGTLPMREDLTLIPERQAPVLTTLRWRDTTNATTRNVTIPENNSTPPPPKTLWERLLEDD